MINSIFVAGRSKRKLGILIYVGLILGTYAHDGASSHLLTTTTNSGTRVSRELKWQDVRSVGPGEIVVCHRDGGCTRYQPSDPTEEGQGKALLEAAAESLPHETIAIGQGTFTMETSLITKAHQTISGAGIDVTILKWAPLKSQPASPAGVQLVGNNYFSQTDGVTVRKMTIDCNAQNHAEGIGIIAVALNGSDILIEDVKVINPGMKTRNESFPVFIYSGDNTAVKTNAHIRRVEVTQPAPILFQSGLSCICLAGVYYNSSIEDCYVHDIDVGDSSGTAIGKPRYVHAFGMSGSNVETPACKEVRIIRNRAINLTGKGGGQGAAIYNDTGRIDGYEISDNKLLNVMRGIHLHEGTAYNHIKIFRNKIRFISGIGSTGGVVLSAHSLANCLIAQNDIAGQEAVAAPDSFAIAATLSANLTVRDNLIHMTGRKGEMYIDRGSPGVVTGGNHRADGSEVQNYKPANRP
jgi:hypothetical protein